MSLKSWRRHDTFSFHSLRRLKVLLSLLQSSHEEAVGLFLHVTLRHVELFGHLNLLQEGRFLLLPLERLSLVLFLIICLFSSSVCISLSSWARRQLRHLILEDEAFFQGSWFLPGLGFVVFDLALMGSVGPFRSFLCPAQPLPQLLSLSPLKQKVSFQIFCFAMSLKLSFLHFPFSNCCTFRQRVYASRLTLS